MTNDVDILNEVVRLLGSVPEKATFRHDLPENHEWLGAVIHALRQSDDVSLAADAKSIAAQVGNKPITIRDPLSRLIVLLQQLKREFEFRCGYTIPRNYFEPSSDQLELLEAASAEFKTAVLQDNEISSSDRDILVAEIAIFEAQLGATRLSPDLISRFVNGFLKGSIVFAAGSVLRHAATRLAELLFTVLGWPTA